MDQLEKLRTKNGLPFYIDQTKYYDKPDLTTMWVLRRHEAVVPVHRSGHQKMLLYGAYCPKIDFLYAEEVLEETSEVTASFLLTL